jgi:hypothetical protein
MKIEGLHFPGKSGIKKVFAKNIFVSIFATAFRSF